MVNNTNTTADYINTTLKNMAFTGDTKTLSTELFNNKNNKHHNYTLLNNILNHNKSPYIIVPPTLKDINTFAVSQNIPIDTHIHKNSNNEHSTDIPATTKNRKK